MEKLIYQMVAQAGMSYATHGGPLQQRDGDYKPQRQLYPTGL